MAELRAGETKIHVKVRVYAMLRRHLPDLPLGQSLAVDLPPETTLGAVLDLLALPRAEVKVSFVNGLARDLDYRLADQDEVALFPPIAGGRLTPPTPERILLPGPTPDRGESAGVRECAGPSNARGTPLSRKGAGGTAGPTASP